MGATKSRNGRGRSGEPPVALAYYRISGSERQRDGLSIDSQQRSVRQYVAGLGMELAGEYSDVLSGKRDDRPGYQAILSAARVFTSDGRDVHVIVKWLDRFGRSFIERIRSRRELGSLGCTLHGVMDGGPVLTVVADVLAAMAEEESRRLGERVSEMREYIVGNGWNTGKPANWGYLWRDPTDEERALGAPRRVLDENPDEAPYVRELWQRAAAGESVRSLTRWAQTLSVVARGGRELATAAISCALHSPIYIARPGGRSVVRDGVDVLALPVGHWPALATDEQWTSVQEQLAGHKTLPRQASGRYLLTGMVLCPVCGGRMSGATQRARTVLRDGRTIRRHSAIVRYVCQASSRGASGPGAAQRCQKSVTASSLDADVLRQVMEPIDVLVRMDRQAEAAVRAWWARRQAAQAAPDRRAEQERERLQAARSQAEQELAEAARLLVRGTLDQAGYNALTAVTRKQVASLDKQLAEVQPIGNLRDVQVSLDDVLARLGGLQKASAGASCAVQRMTVSTLVVSVRPQADGPGRWRAAIEWTEMGSLLLAAAGAILGR